MEGKKQFNGITYKSFSDVPKELVSSGYVEDNFVDYFVSKCEYYSEKFLQDDCITKLPLLINLLSSCRNKVSVLDYGGGVGEIYFGVGKYLISPGDVSWNVVDVDGVVAAARDRITNKKNLFFHNNIESVKDVDVLLFRQSLQIIEDYKSVMRNICSSFEPDIIYISGVSAGENEEYLTLVLLEGDKGLPCYIFNEKELVGYVNSLGYILLERYIEDIDIDLSGFTARRSLPEDKTENKAKGYVFLREGVFK
jgi:putative methyltransferase (TIGR04325 family)